MYKKKLHLISNAHIDSIWQWDWQEGASAAISTFQSVVNLSKEYDFIFCHNEVNLYQYIEEYAPKLFEDIKALIKAGKWHIMGGWYLQPDCTMPSGESFVRHILTGKRYFEEKFGVTPTTAVNCDPFGHTRGLVQIIAKCGQDSYMTMRPYEFEMHLEDDRLWWEGFDGTRIKYKRFSCYSSLLGESLNKIKEDVENQPEDIIESFWGVGNHGGGPSRKDLQDIKEYIEEMKKEGMEVVYSTPEQYMSEIVPDKVYNKSLYLCMPGCYVSMSRLKRLHIEAENKLYFAEKICSLAALKGYIKYPHELFDSITEDLMNSEFHDVLPGTCIPSGEENGIKLLHHSILDSEKVTAKALFALTNEELPADEGEYPIFVFNPHPYEFETDVECEFSTVQKNLNEEMVSHISVYDEAGNLLISQITKEDSNINADWRKRLLFTAKLKPMSLNRFSVRREFAPPLPARVEEYIYQDDNKYIEIDRATGLLKSFKLDGIEYVKDAFAPVLFDDNEDPWGMSSEQLRGLGKNPERFDLCKKTDGVFGGLKSVQVIENGPIYLGIEAFFEKDSSKVRVEYRIYKKRNYIDVNVDVFWQEKAKLLRLAVPVKINGDYIGQTAFGTDNLFMDGTENVAHRFVAVRGKDKCLAVINNCTYGSMYKDGTLYISLLRSAGYCAHPIEERQLVADDRYINYMDLGKHSYSFRVAVAEENELERMAMEFNQKPFAQNLFPTISEYTEDKLNCSLVLSDKNIVLVTMKQSRDNDYFILRLMNNSAEKVTTTVSIGENNTVVTFGKYEVKTLRYDGHFDELDRLEI